MSSFGCNLSIAESSSLNSKKLQVIQNTAYVHPIQYLANAVDTGLSITKPSSPIDLPNLPSITLPRVGPINGGIIGSGIIQSILQRGNISEIISLLTRSGCIIDRILGGSGNVTRTGDLIIGTNCNDRIFGTNHNDIIYTKSGDDLVYAKDGNDIIFGGPGSNRLYGGNGNDLISPGAGISLADGGTGDDALVGGAGGGILAGGSGDDKLFGGTGGPIMYGGSGADHFDCPLPALGLATGIVMDYSPTDGDTISGPCKLVNTLGTISSGTNVPLATLPDTGETDGTSTQAPIIPSQ